MVEERKVPKGYKMTEVGVIPEDWEVIELGQYVVIRSGESPTKFTFYEDGIPYFKVEQLNNSIKYQEETPFYIKVANPVIKGSIIFPKRGAAILLNKVRILTKDSYMDTNLMTLTPINEKISNEYIYYMLSYLELWRLADTTSVPQINNKHINPFKLPLAPFPEQQAIAEALSDVDSLIASLEKLIDKKQKIKQGAIQELLTGKKRLPGFKGKWEVKKLGDIADIRKGQLITEKDIITGNVPVIAGGRKPAYYHNKPNRLGKTITISASGANAGYVSFYNEPIFASDCSTISESDKYIIEFIYYFMKFKQEVIYGMQTGGAQPHIYTSDIQPLEINIPQLDEQQAIAQILSDIDAEIENLQQKLNKYKAIKQGMMQELLTGRIRLV